MPPELPAYRALGLPLNPFGELTPAEWAAAAVVDLDPILDWLCVEGRCAQLVGDCGRGKTTHLHALDHALPGSVWRRAGQDPPGPGATVLLDEADAVGPITRWRHLRHATRCAVGVHADFSRELRWTGWEVTTFEVAVRDRATVEAIARRRIESLAGALPDRAPPVDLAALHEATGDDLRALTHALYDAWQRPLETDHGQV